MNKKRSKIGYLPIVGGALAFGWFVKNFQSKAQGNDESLFQKIKNAEQKLYQDGLKRANELDLIKNEIQIKVMK